MSLCIPKASKKSHNYDEIDEVFCQCSMFLCEIGMPCFALSLKFKNLSYFGNLKIGVLSQPDEYRKHLFECCFKISHKSCSLGIRILKVTIFGVLILWGEFDLSIEHLLLPEVPDEMNLFGK